MKKQQIKLGLVRNAVIEAEKRIRKWIRETPLDFSPVLSEKAGCEVYLKLESCQISGSFKYRGAVNFIASHSERTTGKMFVTASTGNHGAAFCEIMKQFGLKGRVYMPETTPDYKSRPLKLSGVEVEFHSNDCVISEKHARQTAEKNDWIYVPPYNDLKVIGGQGTVAVELVRQLDDFDAVFLPVGGGGLAAGVAGYLNYEKPAVRIIGCQPENSPVMARSVEAGKILEMESESTLSDATAGGIEAGSMTFPICQQGIDEFVLHSESEIKEAIRMIMEHNFHIAEGGAALPLASLLKKKANYKNKKVVLIITGKRIGINTLKSIIN